MKKKILVGLVVLLAALGIVSAQEYGGDVLTVLENMIIGPLGVHIDTINGGGSIPALNGPGKATFGIGNGESPSLEYNDHGPANLRIKSSEIMLVVATSDEHMGAIIGYADVNGQNLPFISFVKDNGEPGTNDVFEIAVPTLPYLNGAVLSGGNIQIGHGKD